MFFFLLFSWQPIGLLLFSLFPFQLARCSPKLQRYRPALAVEQLGARFCKTFYTLQHICTFVILFVCSPPPQQQLRTTLLTIALLNTFSSHFYKSNLHFDPSSLSRTPAPRAPRSFVHTTNNSNISCSTCLSVFIFAFYQTL